MPLRLDAPRSLRLQDRDVPLELSRHPRARRISLRLNPDGDGVRMVLPRRTPIYEAVAFAERNSGWILKHLAKVPARIPFADGAVIPLLGTDHIIAHDARARCGVNRDNGVIRVSGGIEHLPRRVGDFLKRWGSCNAEGDLSFSWRLILAPEAVLDYVVAHEVAHLVHLNHSRRFWTLADSLTHDMAGAKAWLGRHSAELWRYG